MVFDCPACGGEIEAPARDAGREVECPDCRELVRVPRRRPRPADDDPPDLAPADAAAAVGGLRLLKYSLALYFVGLVVGVGLTAARLAVDGPRAVLAGDPGKEPGLLIAGAVAGAVIGLAAAALRVAGYARCRPVGRAVGSDGLLTPAVIGVVLQGVTVLAMTPVGLFPAKPADQNPVVTVAVMIGGFLALAGVGLELCAVFWYRAVLDRLAGPAAARRVRTYLVTLAVAVAGLFVGACGFGMAIGVAAAMKGRQGPPGGPGARPAFDPADLPAEVLAFGGVMAGLGAVVGLWLCWQYLGILSACRDAVAAAAGPAEV